MEPIRKVGAVILRDRKLLACKKRGLEPLISPGGKPEPGELPLQTLVREIREELGVGVHKARLLDSYTGPSAEPGRSIEMITFLVTLDAEPHPCQEIEGLVWIDRHFAQKGVMVAPLFGEVIVPDLVRRGLL